MDWYTYEINIGALVCLLLLLSVVAAAGAVTYAKGRRKKK